MNSRPRYDVGDWLWFYRSGEMTVAVVSYVRGRAAYPYGWDYLTDLGVVSEADVLEGRSGVPGEEVT